MDTVLTKLLIVALIMNVILYDHFPHFFEEE